MQVQVVENRAVLVAKVHAITPHEVLKDDFTVTVDVEGVDAVQGLPNLMRSSLGMRIDLTVAAAELKARRFVVGKRYRFLVKKTSPTTVFVLPEATPH